MFGRFKRIGYQYQTVYRFAAQQKFDNVRVDMYAVRDDFARDFRMNKYRSDGSGVAVVHTAHGVEQVGYMHNSCLHAFNHLFVCGVCVSGL